MMNKLSDEMLDNISGGTNIVESTLRGIARPSKNDLRGTLCDIEGMCGTVDEKDPDKTKQALDTVHRLSSQNGQNNGRIVTRG